MMKKFIFIIIAALSMLIFSCTDLTEEIYSSIPYENYPENEDQVAAMAVAAYARMQDLVDDGGWWYLAQESSSDELTFPTRDTDWDDGGKWRVMHQHEWSNDVDAVNSMWGNLYESIAVCNKRIVDLENLPDSEVIDAKITEVEVVRSFYYYLLLDNYGAVPYITSSDEDDKQPYRNSRESVFNSITDQLEEALPSLKLIKNPLMATRYMAYTLLSKLYMNAEIYTGTPQYAKASMYMDSVLQGPFALEGDVMAPFVTNNEGSSENIFTIPFDEDNFQGFRIHMRSLHYQSNLTFDMKSGPWNGCAVVKDFFDKYEATDARQDYFLYGPQTTSGGLPIKDDAGVQVVLDPFIPALQMNASNTPAEIKNSGARVIKYEIAKGAKENLSNDFVLFRLTDIMLMKAELILTPGSGITGDADALVNPIRQRAGVSSYSGVTFEELKEERGREMFMEGHRRQDLIRWGEFGKEWWEKPADTEDRTMFPIPKWATDSNPNLLETPV